MPVLITPEDIIQTITWTRKGKWARVTISWGRGNATFEKAPDLSGYDPDKGVNIFSLDLEDRDLRDGNVIDWSFSDGVPARSR